MIRFDGVTKVFPNGYVGLDGVSFAVEPEEFIYITGESGAGKTTLIRLLIRELLPTEGSIYLGEDNVVELPRHKVPHLRRKVGVVFQDYKLIAERNVRENVAVALEILGFPHHEVMQKVSDVLDLVGLPEKELMFPAQLSGGELQRVAIARALALAPQVLFADEPTGNLDQKTGHGIIELLRKVRDLGTTVFVTTHDSSLIKKFPGRRIHIHKGKVEKDIPTPEKPKKESE